MADAPGNRPFEERLRRMILSQEPDGQTTQHQPQNIPVVRLPVMNSHAAAQTQDTALTGGLRQSQSRTQTGAQQTNTMLNRNVGAAMSRGDSPYISGHPQPGPTRTQSAVTGATGELAARQQQTPGTRHGQEYAQPHQNTKRFQKPWRQGMDPNAFGGSQQTTQYSDQSRQFYDPAMQFLPPHVQQQMKAQYLQAIVDREIPLIEMSKEERQEKEAFRLQLQQVCQELCTSDTERLPSVELYCFGSFQSGFASAGSDMDLVIVPKDKTATAAQFSLSEDDLPRRLELQLLQAGYGARLLTRTRVPIIKVCELPGASFLSQLREERGKWNMLSFEAKYPHLRDDDLPDGEAEPTIVAEIEAGSVDSEMAVVDAVSSDTAAPASSQLLEKTGTNTETTPASSQLLGNNGTNTQTAPSTAATAAESDVTESTQNEQKETKGKRSNGHSTKVWVRERKAGPLDFPKEGVGIQSDINFFNPLGLHNTQMLRCYSLCDPRVRPMVLFVKAWAKKRKINSAYSGTLSSYGYVLMVLHFLVNVVRPPVLPNLQSAWRPHAGCTPQGADRTQIDNWVVDFWRREDEIVSAASRNMLTTNRDSLGQLLAGFFRYYASQSGVFSFHWMQQVLSLRSQYGVMSKEEKGWIKARTEEGEGKKVQYRYLFCIEDPFELDHNVARTVTHFGIVAIRDEFRRANRILMDVGMRQPLKDGELFDAMKEAAGEADVDVNAGLIARDGAVKQQQKSQLARADLDTKDVAAFPALASTLAGPTLASKASSKPVKTAQVKEHDRKGGTKTGKASQADGQGTNADGGASPASRAKNIVVEQTSIAMSAVADGEAASSKPKKHHRRRPQRAQQKIVLNSEPA